MSAVVAVVVGAVFLLVSGQPAVAQSGSLDLSFAPGSGPNSTVFAVVIDGEGKIVIGGDFTQVAGTSRGHIARLNADGAVTWNDSDMADKTFDLTIFDNAINEPDHTVEFEIESVTADGRMPPGSDRINRFRSV